MAVIFKFVKSKTGTDKSILCFYMEAVVKDSEELVRRIALTKVDGVGPVLARNLVGYCGSVEGVFRQARSSLEKVPGIGARTAGAVAGFRDFDEAEKEARYIADHGISALFFTDEAYPARLAHCPDAPVMLYYKGTADLNAPRMLSVVGTRSATDYGKQFTDSLLEGLSHLGITVVSGLAYGIDAAAHRAALKLGLDTIGVLGHGLDRVYPPLHTSLAGEMAGQGGLLTEYPSGTNPDRENFPERNRVIAGICDAVVVVEAARSGGALITAEIANSYNRDVFALPGRLTDTYSAGCNHLVKINKAVLIESARDIEYIMGWQEKTPAPGRQRELFTEISETEKPLVELLSGGRVDIDRINRSLDMPVSRIAALLLGLECKGVVRALPGKIYELA